MKKEFLTLAIFRGENSCIHTHKQRERGGGRERRREGVAGRKGEREEYRTLMGHIYYLLATNRTEHAHADQYVN